MARCARARGGDGGDGLSARGEGCAGRAAHGCRRQGPEPVAPRHPEADTSIGHGPGGALEPHRAAARGRATVCPSLRQRPGLPRRRSAATLRGAAHRSVVGVPRAPRSHLLVGRAHRDGHVHRGDCAYGRDGRRALVCTKALCSRHGEPRAPSPPRLLCPRAVPDPTLRTRLPAGRLVDERAPRRVCRGGRPGDGLAGAFATHQAGDSGNGGVRADRGRVRAPPMAPQSAAR